MEKVVTVLLALVGLNAAVADAAYGAAPPGSRGSIDFRYPDYIVKPLVPCPYEGVFPHPRNCTWYYRCYDRYNLGFFNRAYFECEPGTVFSDALDQCVFGYVNEDCSPIILSTPRPGEITMPYVPQPPTTAAPVPTTAPPVTCSTEVESCSFKTICPQEVSATTYVAQVEVCEVADWRCSNGTSVPLCPAGYILSRTEWQCIPDQSLCQLNPRPEGFSTVCEDVVENCTDVYACLKDPAQPQLLRRCQVARECSSRGQLVARQPLCGEGHEFDALSNSCRPRVVAFEGCYPSAPVYPAPPAPQCTQQARHCLQKEVCNSPQQKALVCHQVFSCEGTANSALQQERNSPPVAAETCVDIQVPPTCEVQTSNCSSAYFCPATASSTEFVPRLNVCTSAVRVCDGEPSTANPLCGGGVYDVDNERCLDSASLCAPIVRPSASIVCEDVLEGCQDYTVCEAGTEHQVRVCDLVTACSQDGNFVSSSTLCSPGTKFDAVTNQCIEPPSPSSCTPGVTEPTTPKCHVEGEVCAVLPVCNSVQSSLVCRRFFSCQEPLSDPVFQAPVVPGSSSPSCIDVELPEACDETLPVTGSNCSQVALCPAEWSQTSFVLPPVQSVCQQATECSGGRLENFCEPGQVYLNDEQSCLSEQELCKLEPREESSIVCEDVLLGCTDSYMCTWDASATWVERFCKLERVCSREGQKLSEKPLCPNRDFDPSRNKCWERKYTGLNCSTTEELELLPKPQCEMMTERCRKVPVCGTDLTALSCTHLFSCEPSLATYDVRTAPLHGDIECENIPSLRPTPAPTCSVVRPTRCRLASQCTVIFNVSSFVSTIEVCDEAVTECNDSTSSPTCTEGQVYSLSDERCIPKADLCGKLPPRNTSSLLCEDVVENCQDRPICPDSPRQANIVRTCDMTRVCYRDRQVILREPRCPGGHYDVFANECSDANPAIYRCAVPSPPLELQPSCSPVSEQCTTVPSCGSHEPVTLCSKLFACNSTTSTTPAWNLYAKRTDAACLDIPEPTPTECSVVLDRCEKRAVCPTEVLATQFVPQFEVCQVAVSKCSNGSSTPLCSPGSIYNKESKFCEPESSLCGPSRTRPDAKIVCTDVYESCEDLFTCPTSPQQPEVVRMCDLNRECRQNGLVQSTKPLCPRGKKFDAYLNKCVVGPQESAKCASDLPLPEQKTPQCSNVTEVCVRKPICDSTDTALMCYQLLVCQDTSSASVRSNFFRAEEDCIAPSTVTSPGSSTTVTNSYSIECSAENEIPLPDGFRNSCFDIPMCAPPMIFSQLLKICKSYFRCKTKDGILSAEEETCPPNQMFILSEKSCQPRQKGGLFPCGDPPPASDTDMPEIQEISTTTTMKPQSELFPQEFNTTLVCTYDKEIPYNDDVLRINCDPVPMCDASGKFQGNQLLCTRFYVCRWDPAMGHFFLEDSVCSDQTKLFSYDSASCVFPTNACRV